uniref:Uncharacterized protein n=1 Tax=Vitis vinifera TaxID=29760 RepID=A5AZ71_VITVI|nr:hypothetical protein VITISV_004935 [Vitis vinifera]
MPQSMVQRLRVHHHGVCIATHENKVELFQRKPLLTSTAPAFGRELPMGHAPPTPTHVNPFYFSQKTVKFCFQTRRGRTSTAFVRKLVMWQSKGEIQWMGGTPARVYVGAGTCLKKLRWREAVSGG